MQAWSVLAIFTVCPLLGGLPLIDWITVALTGRSLKQQGTGNVSVSAAFYHGGRLAGILAVLSEAAKGIVAVLLARFLFPDAAAWELLALMALVVGRYGMAKGAGTTNVVWGAIAHDPEVAGLVFTIGMIGFTIVRERKLGRLGVLVLFPLITILLRPQQKAVGVVAIALSLLLTWIYQQIPDDLNLPVPQKQGETRTMFRFFRGDGGAVSLSDRLDARVVGEKAATLSVLKRWDYAVPAGWVLLPGDDPEPLIEFLQPSPENPLVVRSTAVGEDSQRATAAGQYASFLNITSNSSLQQAIVRCLNSYDRPAAVEYRRSRNLPEASMAVLIQTQVRGVFSGVAFSRDPVKRHGDEVVIEALPGDATRVVSGQETPAQYRVVVLDGETTKVEETPSLPDVPPELIHDVAVLARQLEDRYNGIPQDIEWSYDDKQLWVLQSRPISTMLPIWTRKIAAEVIPGTIRPLTWSINRPLTCGVWGEIFTIVLGSAAAVLDFEETATLQYSRAYFNASLLGEIFLRMGLPPESLEFLTRGAKFSKPPLMSTIGQLPGLLRLLRRECKLEQDFEHDYSQEFAPKIEKLHETSRESVSDPEELLARIDGILLALKRATYYSILAPLSFALRQALLKVADADLDYSLMPEVAAARSLNEIAIAARHLLPELETLTPETIFGTLSELPDGQTVLEQFQQFLSRYGYLSSAATDIATPRWQEDPKPIRKLFVQQIGNIHMAPIESSPQGLKAQVVQARLNLKARVTKIYNQLLAELRWSFVALEQVWLRSGMLQESGDIFFLQFSEIRSLIAGTDNGELSEKLPQLIGTRRSQLQQDKKLTAVPYVVYGNAPPAAILNSSWNRPSASQQLRGIGASPGQVEGEVKILRSWQEMPDINRNHILVVPYTDAGWSPLLARAGGLVAEVGGRLSHGAIVAREYGIPAVMDVRDATILLQDGQCLRIDGQLGTVEAIVAHG